MTTGNVDRSAGAVPERDRSLLDKLYHLYYKAESLLDARTLQPTYATVFSDERGMDKRSAFVLDAQGVIRYAKVYEPGTIPESKELLEQAGFVRDYQSMTLYAAWQS